MTIVLNANITLGYTTKSINMSNCTINGTNALQYTCPINIELLQNTVISYVLQLAQNGTVVDTIVGMSTIKAVNVAITSISYDFKRYYFLLVDAKGNLAVGVALAVNSAKAVQNSSFFYFDTTVTGPVTLVVSMTNNSNAVLYNISQNLTTLQRLYLTNSIKFITNFTVATTIVGTNINGTCVGMCYLQCASNSTTVNATIVSTVNSSQNTSYTIAIEGYLTQVVINPTFVLQQQPGLAMTANISIAAQQVVGAAISTTVSLQIPLQAGNVINYTYAYNSTNNATLVYEVANNSISVSSTTLTLSIALPTSYYSLFLFVADVSNQRLDAAILNNSISAMCNGTQLLRGNGYFKAKQCTSALSIINSVDNGTIFSQKSVSLPIIATV